jgi:hypothetical protein
MVVVDGRGHPYAILEEEAPSSSNPLSRNDHKRIQWKWD